MEGEIYIFVSELQQATVIEPGGRKLTNAQPALFRFQVEMEFRHSALEAETAGPLSDFALLGLKYQLLGICLSSHGLRVASFDNVRPRSSGERGSAGPLGGAIALSGSSALVPFVRLGPLERVRKMGYPWK